MTSEIVALYQLLMKYEDQVAPRQVAIDTIFNGDEKKFNKWLSTIDEKAFLINPQNDTISLKPITNTIKEAKQITEECDQAVKKLSRKINNSKNAELIFSITIAIFTFLSGSEWIKQELPQVIGLLAFVLAVLIFLKSLYDKFLNFKENYSERIAKYNSVSASANKYHGEVLDSYIKKPDEFNTQIKNIRDQYKKTKDDFPVPPPFLFIF